MTSMTIPQHRAGRSLISLVPWPQGTWEEVEVLRASGDGSFVEHWQCWDQLGLLRQLGAIEEPAEPSHP